MAKQKTKKQAELAAVTEKLERAKGVAVASYTGLTVAATESLRKKLKDSQGELLAVKKTLFGLALRNLQMPDALANLEGSLIVAFSYGDEITAAKVLAEFVKQHREVIVLEGGLVEGSSLDKAGINTLANLPTRQELFAKMVGSLQRPLGGLVGVLNGVLSQFVRTLEAVRQSRAV